MRLGDRGLGSRLLNGGGVASLSHNDLGEGGRSRRRSGRSLLNNDGSVGRRGRTHIRGPVDGGGHVAPDGLGHDTAGLELGDALLGVEGTLLHDIVDVTVGIEARNLLGHSGRNGEKGELVVDHDVDRFLVYQQKLVCLFGLVCEEIGRSCFESCS